LYKLKESANDAVKNLLDYLMEVDDFDKILGIYNVVENATPELYTTQVSEQANHFLEQIADVITGNGKFAIVTIDAYGKKRLAKVKYDAGSGFRAPTYLFYTWITPDVEPLYRKFNPDPREIPASNISNHIPDPVDEPQGERVVRMNAWGKFRLAVVLGQGGKDVVFVKWVSKRDEPSILAKGEQQVGGINEISPGRIKDLRAPEEE
jgi:hypothetical protein